MNNDWSSSSPLLLSLFIRVICTPVCFLFFLFLIPSIDFLIPLNLMMSCVFGFLCCFFVLFCSPNVLLPMSCFLFFATNTCTGTKSIIFPNPLLYCSFLAIIDLHSWFHRWNILPTCAAKLDSVKTYMRMRRVPEHLKIKVIKWFDYLWMTQKSSDEEKSVGFLPGQFLTINFYMFLWFSKLVERILC